MTGYRSRLAATAAALLVTLVLSACTPTVAEPRGTAEEQLSQLRALVEVLMAERHQSSGGSHELASSK